MAGSVVPGFILIIVAKAGKGDRPNGAMPRAPLVPPHGAGASGVGSCAGAPPPAAAIPTTELAKTERGPISTRGPSLFSMSPNRATASGRINFFLPLAAQPLTIPSWLGRSMPVPRGVPAGWPSAATPVLPFSDPGGDQPRARRTKIETGRPEHWNERYNRKQHEDSPEVRRECRSLRLGRLHVMRADGALQNRDKQPRPANYII